uniref:SFRICE_036352 n=1 Tax=Spodoptera frugiperda TaxID=7108 RepID=A0A2H1WYD0_SPOFR
MEVLVKSVLIGAAALVAAVTIAVEWWQYRQVPKTYAAYGQRKPNPN